MSKIVTIDILTKRDNNNIGDIVEIHEDDVDLSGPGYAGFKIIETALSKNEIEQKLNNLLPQKAMAFRSAAPTNEWSVLIPEEKRVWKNTDGKWYFEEDPPKYNINLLLDQTDINILQNTTLSIPERLVIFDNKAKKNIAENPNNLIEAVDLNK